jgi:hypothetical protein
MKPYLNNRYPSIDFTPLILGILIIAIYIISSNH